MPPVTNKVNGNPLSLSVPSVTGGRMRIVGILIIIIALLVTAWWVCSDHAHKEWAVTICIIALFAGVFLTLQDRAIEVSFKWVGKIKAAARQATTDASDIACVKERVEAQSASWLRVQTRHTVLLMSSRRKAKPQTRSLAKLTR